MLGGRGPTDSFVGIPPLVTDPATGQTNANGTFIASNSNPVPQAGKFYNGADLDRGPSDLAVPAEGRDPHPVLSGGDLPREPAPDLLQERLALVLDRP